MLYILYKYITYTYILFYIYYNYTLYYIYIYIIIAIFSFLGNMWLISDDDII